MQDIEIGNTVSFSPTFQTLSADLVCSKALDNRAGCYVLIEALRRLRDEDLGTTVAFVGTVQEELSCDGSLAPAQAFGAAMAVAVDGTVSYDTPDTEGQGDVRCGRGPVITRMLRTPGLNGWTPHPRIAAFLEQVATTAGIPFQRDAVAGLMSDARPLQLGGIPSAVIGIPMRGKHSPAEIISVTDLQHTVDLVVALVRSVGALKLDRGRG